MNRWELTDEIRNEYKPIVEKFIKDVENNGPDNDLLEKDFSDTKLNPYILCEILKELGYERVNQDDNGWQLDFWVYFHKDNCKPIQVNGCGMTFELKIAEDDTDYYEDYNQEYQLPDRVEPIKNVDYDDKNDNLRNLLDKVSNMLKGIEKNKVEVSPYE